jgi:hypothetical protein
LLLVACPAYFQLLKMKAALSSETSVNVYQTRPCHIPEGDTVRSPRCENRRYIFYCEIVCGIGTISVENSTFINAEMIRLGFMVHLASQVALVPPGIWVPQFEKHCRIPLPLYKKGRCRIVPKHQPVWLNGWFGQIPGDTFVGQVSV